ncbi:MAG: VTT domain-containing protein [Acidobacteriota bacterium]
MSLAPSSEIWAYLTIFVAAAVEGETVLVAACVLVEWGLLNPLGVFLAGALGGSAGDQFFFYLVHSPLRRWVQRFPVSARRKDLIMGRVRAHAVKMILASRFLPGLRIAIPMACAYAKVSPLRYSGLSLVSAAGWAAVIMLATSKYGPAVFRAIGLRPLWATLASAALVLAFFYWIGHSARPSGAGARTTTEPGPSESGARHGQMPVDNGPTTPGPGDPSRKAG